METTNSGKVMMVLQRWDGSFIEYAFLTPQNAGKKNAAIRKVHGNARWTEYEHMNEKERLVIRRQFSGGWKFGDQFADPEEYKAKMFEDAFGVYRWESNKSVPPKDIMALMALTPEETAKHDAARDADMDAFVTEYRANQLQRTPEQMAEERAEARAAHGPGVTLVNVLTGDTYTT